METLTKIWTAIERGWWAAVDFIDFHPRYAVLILLAAAAGSHWLRG